MNRTNFLVAQVLYSANTDSTNSITFSQTKPIFAPVQPLMRHKTKRSLHANVSIKGQLHGSFSQQDRRGRTEYYTAFKEEKSIKG